MIIICFGDTSKEHAVGQDVDIKTIKLHKQIVNIVIFHLQCLILKQIDEYDKYTLLFEGSWATCLIANSC